MTFSPTDIIELIGAAAGVVAAIGYTYGKFTNGLDKEKTDVIKILKEKIEALENKSTDQGKEITSLTEEVQKLKKTIEEKDKKLEEVLQILQGRNPDMDDFIKSGKEYIMISTPILDTLKRFLDKQII